MKDGPLSRADAAALLVVLVATVAFFWPMLRPWGPRQYVVEGDFSRQFYPYRAFAAQEWWAGRIPLWNPDVFAGHPFQADIQTGVFYPLALADAIVFGRQGLPFVALEGEIVVHTFLAAAFTYLLARRLSGSRLGGLLAGFAFGFGGFITSYPAQQLAVLETAAWLPLVVLLLDLAAARPVGWRWLVGASIAFALAILAGHPQTDLFVVYAAEGYLVWRLWLARGSWQQVALAAVLFPTVAGTLAAVQLGPTLDFLRQSSRADMDYQTAAHGYLPSALWQVFVPFWHDEKALALGVVALLLALVGAIASRREPLAYWTVVGLIALPLSTGGATPLFWLLYHAAPGWNLFRDQERVIVLFSLAGALLAARGLAALQRPELREVALQRWLGVAAGGALVAGGLCLAAPRLGAAPALRLNLGGDALILALATGVLAWRKRQGQLGPVAAAVLVALVAAEAFAINQGNNLGPTVPDPRPRLAATAAFVRAFPEPFRVRGISEAVFPSNYGALLGMPTIGGDSPIEPQRIHEMLNADADWRVWQILNVKFFLSDGGPLAGLKLVFQDGPLKTYFMEDSLPRAWAVTNVQVARSSEEARQAILQPGYHPGNVVVVEGQPTLGPFVPGPRPAVRLTHLDPQRVSIDASSTVNAMLVLANAYYPDWRAYRDGAAVPVFRANYLAMAFELPPGQHHYEIVYEPRPFYVGAGISLLALLGVVGFLARADRRRPAARSVAFERALSLAWWVGALALVGGGFALRLHALGGPNLTNDEWFMLRNHDEGPLWIVHQAHTFEPHPLLYYLGLAGWIEVAGRSEFALRFPSAAFGAILVAALLALGVTLLGRRTGLLAGLLGAINPYQLAESQNARNYEMVAATSAVASALFLVALRRGRRRDWFAYGVAMLLALNTHYDAALVFAAHVGYVALQWAWSRIGRRWWNGSERPNPPLARAPLPASGEGEKPACLSSFRRGAGGERWAGWLLTSAVVAATFALWLAYAYPALAAYHGYFPTPVGVDRVLLRSLATFSLGAIAPIRDAAPVFLLAAMGSVWLARSHPDRALFLGLYVLLPIVAVSVLFLFRPMFDERYLIVLAPGYLVLVAAGAEGLLRRFWPLGALALAAVVALSLVWVPRTFQAAETDRPDFRGMAAWVATYGRPDDPIVATGHGQAELFSYYYPGPQPIQVVDDVAAVPATLAAAERDHQGLWLLPYWESPVDHASLDELSREAALVAERWFVNARALYFATTASLTRPAAASGTWAERLSLTQADLPDRDLTPGDPLAVAFHWQVAGEIATPKLSLRLVDPSGTVEAQSDALLDPTPSLAPGARVSRLGLFVPLVLPPGPYDVAILLYDPASGQPLPLASTGRQRAGALVLGSVHVGVRARPVPLAETDVARRDDVRFAEGISLVGHDEIGSVYSAGDWLAFRLLWRADRAPLPPLTRTLALESADGREISQMTVPILPSYPTSSWQAGQVLAERVRLLIPPTLASGDYRLVLRVGTARPGARLADLRVAAPERLFTRPPVQRSIDARLGSFATLVGSSLATPAIAPGGTVRLGLVWQARGPANRAYTVFVHLLDPTGKIRGQVDRPPVAGQRPTDGWVAGEFLQDDYAIPLAADAPTGPYSVEVGLYDPTTGARVPVVLADGSTADHVIVASLGVGG